MAPGFLRSSGMPPVTRSSGASGPRNSSRLIRTFGGTPSRHVSMTMATQSQLDVCGAPTRMPVVGHLTDGLASA